MTVFATALFVMAAATWLGAIVFQSAVVAPAVFVDLDEAAARSFLRTLFPRFYRLGLICGVLMLLSLAWLGGMAEWRGATMLGVAAATIIMVLLEAISLWLVPRINAARDAGAPGRAQFARLHRASVLLTVVILLLGIGVLTVIAARAAAGL